MDTHIIQETTVQTFMGGLSFPQVVANLEHAGVEFYHVDYVARRKTFYADTGTAVVSMPFDIAGLPEVAGDFNAAALQAAIRDSQQHGQRYDAFSRRAMAAGVQGYFAFLRGKRVTYFGRQGDQHTEWFPGAGPSTRS